MKISKGKLKIQMVSLPQNLLKIVCVTVSALLFITGIIVPSPLWLKVFINAACVVLTGYDLLFDAGLKLLKKHVFSENLFILIAAVGAFFIGRGMEGAAVMLLFRLGELLHGAAVKRSANTIESLVDLRPEVVNAVINGAIVRQSPGKINVGDVISVSPGERIALDGIVISGESELDTSALNGKADLHAVSDGSAVLSGSVNMTGILNIRVTEDFDHSTVSRILKLVENAEYHKSKTEKRILRFARISTPAVAAAALLIGVVIPLIGGLPINPWLSRAFGLLVLASPGALVISVALTYFAGIGGASKKGILFKDAGVVDTVANATSVVFDKTGTLTNGNFQVVDINSYGIPEKRLLMLAAYAELHSNHPIARSIVAAADILPDFAKISDFKEYRGQGAEIEMGGNTISVGNALLMAELGITPDISQADASVVYVAVNGQYAGRILLNDTVKPDSKKAVKDLHMIGVDRIVIFTGDKKEVASEIASQLGIREFYAECLPEDKVTRLKSLMDMQLAGDKLVFVGNYTDDAPSLAIADAGIALGGLPSEANDPADMIVLTDEPSKIAVAIAHAQNTCKIVSRNILWTMGLKGFMLLLVLVGLATMWMAVLADVGFALFIVYNAMRAAGFTSREIKEIRPEEEEDEEESGAEV